MSQTECPHCHATNEVAPSHIGQYVTCKSCGCKYYIYVPPLEGEGSSTARAVSRPTPHPRATPDVNSGSQVMMRQESLLAEIHSELVALRRRITVACLLVVVAATALITVLLLR